MKLKIKKEFENVVIGYNGSGAVIGGRSDLHKLYEIAISSMPSWLIYFENATEEVVLEGISELYKDAKEAKEIDRGEKNKT